MPSRVVRVTWVDSALMNVQVDTLDLPKPEEIVTVGFLTRETPEYVVVSRDKHHGGTQWRGSVSIPRACIVGKIKTVAK